MANVKRWFDSEEKREAKAQAKKLRTAVWKVHFIKHRKGEMEMKFYVGEKVPRSANSKSADIMISPA